MKGRSVYQLSGRQLLSLAFVSALIAVGAAAFVYSYARYWAPGDNSGVTYAEAAPAGISDPSAVTDETNSIEVYKAVSPAVAFVNTTSYTQDFWGDVQEGKGNGSGSVIDNQGHILTNYHVIEGATKLSVNLDGKEYPAKVVGGDPDTDL